MRVSAAATLPRRPTQRPAAGSAGFTDASGRHPEPRTDVLARAASTAVRDRLGHLGRCHLAPNVSQNVRRRMVPHQVEPWGRLGLKSYRKLDDDVSDALGIPRRPSDRQLMPPTRA